MDTDRDHSVVKDGALLLAPALSLTVYFGQLTDELKAGLVKTWSEVIGYYGAKLQWYITEAMPKQEAVDNEVLNMFPFWFGVDQPVRRRYFFYLHEGRTANDVSPWAIDLYIENPISVPAEQEPILKALYGETSNALGDIANCFRISFPANKEGLGLPFLLGLVDSVFQGLDYIHANAGYSLMIDADPNNSPTVPWKDVMRISHRHPGYDVFRYDAVSRFVSKKIKTVNWICLLGEELGREFSDSARDSFIKSPEIVIKHLNHKVLIQAGEVPELGDINRGHRLGLYEEVAKALAPFLCTSHYQFSRVFDEENTTRWLNRFLQ